MTVGFIAFVLPSYTINVFDIQHCADLLYPKLNFRTHKNVAGETRSAADLHNIIFPSFLLASL